jgi:hypothetical protein
MTGKGRKDFGCPCYLGFLLSRIVAMSSSRGHGSGDPHGRIRGNCCLSLAGYREVVRWIKPYGIRVTKLMSLHISSIHNGIFMAELKDVKHMYRIEIAAHMNDIELEGKGRSLRKRGGNGAGDMEALRWKNGRRGVGGRFD